MRNRVIPWPRLLRAEKVAAPESISPAHASRQPNPRGRRIRRFALLFGLVLFLAGSFPWVWHAAVEWRYRPHIYSAERAPDAQVAVVFGARVYRNGRLSPMLRDRVDTAVQLYHAGKVDRLILSGGNSGTDYDEPAAMAAHALAQGVPADALHIDIGGYRTYDTCYRAEHIFQAHDAILVTQDFHLPRALLLCNGLGVDAVGVKADRRLYAPASLAWSETREVPALVAALVDLIRRQPPPILGEPTPIF